MAIKIAHCLCANNKHNIYITIIFSSLDTYDGNDDDDRETRIIE